MSSDSYNLKCIISNVDSNTYCVRETSRLNEVADLFATISLKVNKLIEYLKKNEMNNKPVSRLVKRYNPKKIVEILPTSQYTAYSENKGEKIALCSTTQKHKGNLIDENTLMFVVLHELAHIMTISLDHTKEFWDNFKQLLIYAKKVNIYTPIDYSKDSSVYCGMDIVHNPYYD